MMIVDYAIENRFNLHIPHSKRFQHPLIFQLPSLSRPFSMDVEDNMHDTNDLESLNDDFYSGEIEDAPMDYYSDYDDDVDDYFNDDDDSYPVDSRIPEQNNSILKESDIWQRHEDDISRVAAILSIPRVAANILLRHYNWKLH